MRIQTSHWWWWTPDTNTDAFMQPTSSYLETVQPPLTAALCLPSTVSAVIGEGGGLAQGATVLSSCHRGCAAAHCVRWQTLLATSFGRYGLVVACAGSTAHAGSEAVRCPPSHRVGGPPLVRPTLTGLAEAGPSLNQAIEASDRSTQSRVVLDGEAVLRARVIHGTETTRQGAGQFIGAEGGDLQVGEGCQLWGQGALKRILVGEKVVETDQPTQLFRNAVGQAVAAQIQIVEVRQEAELRRDAADERVRLQRQDLQVRECQDGARDGVRQGEALQVDLGHQVATRVTGDPQPRVGGVAGAVAGPAAEAGWASPRKLHGCQGGGPQGRTCGLSGGMGSRESGRRVGDAT